LTAALIVASGASVVAGLVTAVGLIAAGMPTAGSVVMGLGFACFGTAFAAVAGLTAQLTKSARAAAGIAGVVLGVAYLLRALGDASAANGLGWLSWLSPVGWWQQSRPFAGDRWWVLLLLLGLCLVVAALAYGLAARRDFGAGLLPDRPGRAAAAAGLRNPLALAWRLQRGSVFAWLAAFAVVGLVLGAMSSTVGDFLDSPQVKELLAKLGGQQSLVDAYFSVELGIAAVFASVFGIQSAMRLRSEETGLRAEAVLATSVGRVQWAWSHLVIAIAGSAVLLAVVGVSAGLVSAVQLGDGRQVGRVAVAALVQIPAVWLVIGIVVAAFGLAPRLIVLGWVALTAFVLLGEFGSLFSLSRWVIDISPFAHVPRLPGGDFTVAPLLWLTVIAAGLVSIGLAAFRRRDVG
jgi:ABC-2 type transport system permease protein